MCAEKRIIMKTRKTLSVLLLTICMCGMFLVSQKASAAEMTPVTPNEIFYGTLESAEDAQYYSFTVDKTGYFNVDFSVTDFAADVRDGWNVKLCYADTGNSFYTTDLTTNTTLPTFNFKEGTKLYIAVSSKSGSDNWAPLHQMYGINIKTVEDKNWEQESNDTAADATVIEADKTYYGNLYYADDVDYYEYVVDHDGYFNVDFSLKDITADVKDGWKVEVCYGDTATGFYSTELTANTTLPAFNFKKGTKLYIMIAAGITSDNWAPRWQEYRINVKTTENKNWEQENNDTSKDATQVTANKTYYGNLYRADDVDYYEYTVENNGYFALDFSPEDITADVKDGWKMEIYNGSTGTKIYSTELSTNTTLSAFNYKKGTKLYIAIAAKIVSDNWAPRWQEYSIRIKTTNVSNWEKETLINGDASWSARSKNATAITLGKKWYGNMCMDEDNDLYKFSTDKTGTVTVKFDPDDVESNLGSGYTVRILTKSGKVAAESSVTSITNVKTYLKKGTYYVEVYRSYGCPILKKYGLTVSCKAQTPAKVSSIRKKGATVSWKKVSGVDGYEISYAKNSKFKSATKIAITDSDTVYYTIYGLQEKKTYYVRVRAYKTTGAGEKVYGGWSSTVKVKR